MALTINAGKISRAVKTVIYGTEGVGKSTLASHFPNPLFLDVEGGTSQMDVRRIETPKSWEELISDVKEVAADPSLCGTLVLDTADKAEGLCIEAICRKYKQNSIEAFGYGKGYTYIGEEWSRLMAAFDSCIAAGINVTVIAHARQRKIELPDQTGSFDHWEMKLTKQAAPLLKEWADLLLFLNYKTYVVSTDNNSRKAQGGKRVMYTSHNPVWDAKNRHGLPEEMDLSFDGLKKIFENTGDTQSLSPLERLKQLMDEAGITDYQVRKIVHLRGKYPEETPIEEYTAEFVEKFCIRYFDKIVEQIRGEEK